MKVKELNIDMIVVGDHAGWKQKGHSYACYVECQSE